MAVGSIKEHVQFSKILRAGLILTLPKSVWNSHRTNHFWRYLCKSFLTRMVVLHWKVKPKPWPYYLNTAL